MWTHRLHTLFSPAVTLSCLGLTITLSVGGCHYGSWGAGSPSSPMAAIHP